MHIQSRLDEDQFWNRSNHFFNMCSYPAGAFSNYVLTMAQKVISFMNFNEIGFMGKFETLDYIDVAILLQYVN